MNQETNGAAFEAFLRELENQDLPPVGDWHPSECRDMDLCIDARGEWYYAGTIFQRPDLVRLLSGLLIHEDGEYFLVSPAEKLRITVEDLPFIVTDFELVHKLGVPRMIFDTNVGFKVPLDREHPLALCEDGYRGGRSPCLLVRDNLRARLGRGVYYRLVEHGIERQTGADLCFGIESDGAFFPLEKVSW